MTDTRETTKADGGEPETRLEAAGLKERVCSLIEALVVEDREQADSDFENLLARTSELVRRKQAMEGTKRETRDLIGEVLFVRLRRALRDLQASNDQIDEIKAAEWVMGMLYSSSVLNDLARSLDQAILEGARPSDYSFAGRADFISIEEVLQLLGSGNYSGMVAIEKDDNRIDCYLKDGLVIFLDPHHLLRRVLPNRDGVSFREIPTKALREAEAMHAEQGTPLLLGLVELGVFGESEVKDLTRTLGLEVLYEFLGEQGASSFFYKKMATLPEFATRYSLRMGVMPILLEGSKQIDDMIGLRKVFPNPNEPIRPVADMFAKIGGLELSPLDIKMLAMINGETSPRNLVASIGLPLLEVYQSLVRFAREGVLVPPGGMESMDDVAFSVEESMERAFEALDANDDKIAVSNALDAVLGDEEPEPPARPKLNLGGGEVSLDDILDARLRE